MKPILADLELQHSTYSTVNPHYSWILYLWICLLAKIFNPKVNTCSAFVVTCRQAQRQKNVPSVCIPSSGPIRWHCPFISALTLKTSILFMVYLMPCFSHFCAFSWWFCCLKCPPSTVLKCCLVFLRTRRRGMCLTEKKRVRWASFSQELP